MPYTLTDFCADLSATLKTKGESGLPDVAQKLSQLLQNQSFVSETFNEDTPIGRRELWHDPATDVYVLAHVQEGGKVGKPHSHGASWAIYGTARGVTEMTEWRRLNPASEDAAGPGKGQAIRARPRPDPGLFVRPHPLHRAPAKGLGDPHHRHRSRRHPALPLPRQDRQNRRSGVSARVRSRPSQRLKPPPQGPHLSL